MSIPRKINIIWMQGFENIPERFRANIRSIIDKNPGYQIIYWDEKSLREVVKSLGPEYLAKWDSFPHMHQRVDFGRYAVLYKTGGGISIDTDVVALKGFDSTPNINTSNFIVSYNASSEFENYIKNGRSISLNNATILVSPNNNILKGLLDHILGLSCAIDQSKESCIQGTTGPREFTTYLNQYKDQITVLDNIYFEPCGSDPFCEIPSASILDHQHEGSWVRDSHKKLAQAWYGMKRNKVAILTALGVIILFLILTSKTTTS